MKCWHFFRKRVDLVRYDIPSIQWVQGTDNWWGESAKYSVTDTVPHTASCYPTAWLIVLSASTVRTNIVEIEQHQTCFRYSQSRPWWVGVVQWRFEDTIRISSPNLRIYQSHPRRTAMDWVEHDLLNFMVLERCNIWNKCRTKCSLLTSFHIRFFQSISSWRGTKYFELDQFEIFSTLHYLRPFYNTPIRPQQSVGCGSLVITDGFVT